MIKSTPAKEVSKDFAVIDVRSDDFVVSHARLSGGWR